jgi:cytochrome c553
MLAFGQRALNKYIPQRRATERWLSYDEPMKNLLLSGLLVAGFSLFCASGRADPLNTGSELYRDCAACHGKDGGGVADGTVPAIAGQPAEVIKRQLESFRSGARTDLRMQHFSNDDHLSGAEAVEAVSRYVAGLRRATPAATGAGRDLSAGATEFARTCAACHGARGQAIASRGIPALAGQHATYLERKMLEAAAGRNSLSQSHRLSLARLSSDRVAAIADWLSREPAP